MDEPDRGAEQPRVVEAGAVPEGAENDKAGSAEGSAQRVGVQAFRGGATSTGGLDTQVMQDEPEQLIRLLLKTAQTYEGPRHREWGIVARYADQCQEALEKHNSPHG